MNIHTINVIARYEVKLLKRSWLFRIFAILVLLILTLTQLSNLSPVFWKYSETWNYVGVTSLIPFFTTYLYNIAQSVIVVFLAGSFLKRDKKLDTAEVIYVRPMSNADYIVGKVWGITRVFLGLNIITLLVGMFVNLVVGGSPFSIFPYLFYLFTISLPSLWFVLGLSFTLMCILKNQAVTFIVMLGIIGTLFFYVGDNLYGVFDFFGVNIPAIFSDVTGHPDLALFLLQRTVYFLGGIALLCFTITLVKRLPHRPWKTVIINICAFVLLLVSVGTGFLYVRHFRHIAEVRKEYIALFDKYAVLPKADISSNDITIKQSGNSLEAECRMLVKNSRGEMIPQVILYLNPGVEILGLEVAGQAVTYKREKQVLLIDQALQPGEEKQITIRYAGPLDENVCYTDIDEKDFLANPTGNTFSFRYGKRYVYLEDRYTILTPECLWYPVAESPAYPAMPYNIKKEFTRYTLTVEHPENRTAISQGDAVREEGKTVFSNATPLPCISVAIGDYEKKAISVDSTDYELYYFKGHDFFSKYFEEIQDTLPAIIREIRADLEVGKNRSYPFSKFVMAETPLPFTGYIRNWKGYTEQVMPEIVFLPERGLRTQVDFRAEQHRIRDWRNQNDIPEDKEIQVQMLKNYINNTFVAETSSDGSMRWSSSPEVNKLNIGAMFFGFTGFMYSADYPIIDVALNTMQNTSESNQRRWFFSTELSDNQRANVYLQDHSFEAAMKDKNIKPQVFYEVLKLKSNFLKSFVVSQIPMKTFHSFLRNFNESHLFKETDLEEFSEKFKEEFHIDLADFIHQWYTTDHAPEIKLKDVDVNQVILDDFTKYRISLKAYNPSDVDGMINVNVESGGGGMRGRGPRRPGSGEDEDNIHHYYIPAGSAREIKIINDDRPGRITVNTMVSRNLPNEFDFNFSKVDTEVSDTLTGAFPIDTAVFAAVPGEIIIDNEDPGFRTIEGNTRHKLKDLFRKEEEDKYQNFMPWRYPSKWTAVVKSSCFGESVHSAVYKSKGTGANKVEWTAEIPKDNYYEIFVWNPKFEIWFWGRHNRTRNDQTQTYTIAYDEEKETASVDFAQEENGWVSLGSYYLPAGRVTVTLTDKVSSVFVSADAVKFTLIK